MPGAWYHEQPTSLRSLVSIERLTLFELPKSGLVTARLRDGKVE